MEPRRKLRLFSAFQLILGLLFVLSSMFTVTTGAAVPRDEAAKRLRQEIPADVDRVFINHGVAYSWPFGRRWCVIGGVTALASLGSLLASLVLVHRVRDQIAATSP